MNRNVKGLVTGALIAAVYAVLTAVSSAFGLAYGTVQFRLSELLCVLPALSPSAVCGLTLGCIISNIGSPIGPFDMLFGTGATLLGALLVRTFRNRLPVWLLFLFPVFANALLVGAEISVFAGGMGFFMASAGVFLGEFVVIYAGGIPLYGFLLKNNIIKA